jgi:hypothetical protein
VVIDGREEIMNLIRKIVRRAKREWDQSVETRRLAPLYSPDPANLNLEAHLSAALDWLKRAQDAGNDRGVSYGVKFGSDFDVSYPETTGYICQTFVELSRRTGDGEFLKRAVEMGHWEVDIQLSDGAVMGAHSIRIRRQPCSTPEWSSWAGVLWSVLLQTTGLRPQLAVPPIG